MPILNRGNRARLQHTLETEGDSVLKTIHFYVLRAGLASGSEVAAVAGELFNEVAVEAFKSVGRLKPEYSPKQWLLGIATNLIKRRQAEAAKRNRREPLMRDLFPQMEETLSDDELFDLLPVASDGALGDLEAMERLNSMLSGLSKSDADLLRLAVLHDLNGEELAQELGISPGTARVRLHRALNRLRALHLQRTEDAHE